MAGEMSLELHCYVWQDLESNRDDYKIQDGIQLYLDYCKHNGITQEQLARETGYDGIDIMTFYDEQTVKAIKGISQDEQLKVSK